jgi:predicted flap endonuclease-1-like 5' DNA nuclease
MDLPSFLIGLVAAWIVALLIYWFQSQRERQSEVGVISYSDHLARMARSEAHAAELQAQLQATQSTCADEKTALQQQIDQLNVQLDALSEEAEGAAPIEAPPVEAPPVEPAPTTAETVEAPAPDDLKRIEGIGPKIESILNNAGIHTFAQLAATEVQQLQQILSAAGERYHLADPHSWPEQSQLAASGDWSRLEALQDQLKGGR